MPKKVVCIDKTTKLAASIRKQFDTSAKRAAQDTRQALKRSFKKRVPRKPSKGSGRTLYLYDESGTKMKPMAEHIRELKKEVRKGNTRYTGKSFSTRKQNGTGTSWVNSVFKPTDETPQKSPSPAGSPPFTWKNIHKGEKGHPQSAYPDYFMSSRVFYSKKEQLNYSVQIKQWKTSEKVFKALEEGESVAVRKKVLIGWKRHDYAVKSTGRARYEKVYTQVNRSVSVSPRPFLKPVYQQMKSRAAEYFKTR